MKTIKSIHELELKDFDFFRMWKTVEYDVPDGVDELVEPLLNYRSLMNGDYYWTRLKGILKDETLIYGIGVTWFNPPDISLLSFYINGNWEVLHKPWAPDCVLKDSGPIPFALKLSKEIEDVFPMKVITDIPDDIIEPVEIIIMP